MERTHALKSFSDDELLRRLSDLLGRSRRDEAELVAHIGEVDRRRLYAREASPSMFAYCTEVLHLSEAEAYLRIAVARASREHPVLLSHAGRRTAAPDSHREACAAPDPGEPGECPEEGRPPVEAGDRGARGGAFAPPGCSGVDAEAAGSPGRMTWPSPPLGRMTIPVPSGEPRLRPDGVAASEFERPPVAGAAARVRTPSRRSRCSAANSVPERPRRGRQSARSSRPASPDPAGRGRAPRPGPLQGPVHRLRRASRQARATAGPHALLGARRRPGRDHRAGRHREAREARGAALRADPGAEEDALGERHLPRDAPDPGRGEASRVRARRRSMPLRGRAGETVHGARRARVPPPTPLRPRRWPLGGQYLLAVSRATTFTWPRSTTAGRPWHTASTARRPSRLERVPSPAP